MRILAIIPARAGSKRLPNKNKLVLGDKPLIAWSIESARGIPEICDILVSTDDPEIAEISRVFGALVPWLRPAELATDESHVVDTCLHALGYYEDKVVPVDGLLLLQPTSPFRKRSTIEAGIRLFADNRGACDVVGVSDAAPHPEWCLKEDGRGLLVPYIPGGAVTRRKQDLQTAFSINGLLYIKEKARLLGEKTFFGENVLPVVSNDPVEKLDIDSLFDFKMSEFFLGAGAAKPR